MTYQYITRTASRVENNRFRYLIIVILFLTASCPLFAEKLPDYKELMQQLGMQQQDIASLNQGEIVFFNVSEGNEKELSVGAVVYMHAQPSKITNFIVTQGLASLDSDVTVEQSIPLQATLASFKGFNFGSGNDDAKNFFTATPGSQFNLSTQEYQIIRDTKLEQPDVVLEVYRNILLHRWQAYRKNGLKGIAAYDRGGDTEVSPGGELRTATLENKLLAQYYPDLYKAWLNYPITLPKDAKETFFWRNRQVENRPTAILVHRIMLSKDAGELILSRQFYVGHSYNSNQLTIVCLPYRDGSLVFYTNRNFTDQVAGFGSSLKNAIGHKQEKGEIVELLNQLLKSLN
jgi:hypothetical protein